MIKKYSFILQLNRKTYDKQDNNNHKIDINNNLYLINNNNKYNLSRLDIITLKNKVNKIIKIYRQYRQKRDISPLTSTRNKAELLPNYNAIENNNHNQNKNCNNEENNKKLENDYDFIGIRDSQGKKNGFGIQKWNDGSKFTGIFVNDQAMGWGIFIHDDGDVYKGEFSNDITNGYGEYIRNNTTVYKGYWINDTSAFSIKGIKKINKEVNNCDIFFSPNFIIPFNVKIKTITMLHDVIFLDMPKINSSYFEYLFKILLHNFDFSNKFLFSLNLKS